MSETLMLALDLIRRPSITPYDAGCQAVISARLESLGFRVQRLPFGTVENCWARRGTEEPLFVFAGHTDVVPAGPEQQWSSPPFLPVIREGYLYGRGAADMKGSLAAMVTACERFIATYPEHRGSIGFLITSDEEGPAQDGTAKVVEYLQQQGERITSCLVGEPSSTRCLGDTIKHGRRGSLHGKLQLQGVQGHIAYPHLAQNPIHAIGVILTALADEIWDLGNAFFPPTSLQISNIHSGTGATNVIPGTVDMLFNFRFSTATTVATLQERVRQIIEMQLLNEEIKRGQVFQYQLDWQLSGMPFLTPAGELVRAATEAIREELGVEASLSTSGGTSDGRFIAPRGAQVIELGPVNATIHQVNERVLVGDLQRLSQVYERILVKLLT